MAGGQERELRRRIRSVQATKKITKAMELIAASQIVRSQNRIVANRPYRLGMARLIAEAAQGDPAVAEKLLGTPESPSAVTVLSVVGDRGLCGAYNTAVLRTTEHLVDGLRRSGAEVRLVTVGRKAPSYLRFRGYHVDRTFGGFGDRPTFADARAVSAVLTAPFLSGDVQQVLMVSTRFVSSSSQRIATEQLLPLRAPGDHETAAEGTTSDAGAAPAVPPGGPYAGPPIPPLVVQEGYTEFEPDAESLLATLGPRAVESEVFSALLEGAAAFFTAQQRAMAAASDNADEFVRTLTRVMNRARQDAITTEIMEIVGGAEALRQSKGA